MAGEIVSLFRARAFNFDGLAPDGEGFVLGPFVDLLRFRQATLLLRLHEVEVTGDAVMNFGAVPIAPSHHHPGPPFLDMVPHVSVSLAGEPSGSLLRLVLPLEDFGAAALLVVLASQPATSTGTIFARLSAGLLGHR